MVGLALVVCLIDIALVFVTFIVLARPEYMMERVANWYGRGEAWRMEVLDPIEEALFESTIRKMQIPLLVLVFSWSFVTGALVCWLRL